MTESSAQTIHGDVRLLQITDTHLYARADGTLKGVETEATLRAVISWARRHHWPPDAIIATGDLVQDETAAGYRRFRSILAGLGVPVHVLPGNHDCPARMSEILGAAPFRIGGQVLLGNWCLLLLDTWVAGEVGGSASPEALHWLDTELDAAAGLHALICLHHQPAPMGSRWLDAVGLDNGTELLQLLASHANVKGVLWGHVHQCSERWHGDIRLMSTPSTCVQFLPGSDEFATDSRPPGYRWLRLGVDGTIDTEVVWVEKGAPT